MHGLTFQMKRAHVAAYRFAFDDFARAAAEGKTELAKMTPARFDIMFLIHEAFRLGMNGVSQETIWKRLGLHRSTISKAITVMEKLELVVRSRYGRSRTCNVSLTKLGVRAIRSAFHLVFTEHRLRDRIEAFFDRTYVRRTRRSRFPTAAMICFLSRLAMTGSSFCLHFGRRADIVFPIDPYVEL